jgi:hypothetical protein
MERAMSEPFNPDRDHRARACARAEGDGGGRRDARLTCRLSSDLISPRRWPVPGAQGWQIDLYSAVDTELSGDR